MAEVVLPQEREATKKWWRKRLGGAKETGVPNAVWQMERKLARHDLFYLLVVVLKRGDIDRDWLFARCREVQAKPNGYVDLWSREHYKSSIITCGLTIQDILNDPEVTIGIFSHTRPIAKGFLRQIKREFEGNEDLVRLFPEICYKNPQHESPKWSEDDGLIVKRKTNPKEATIEAWGLVDGQPTSKHYKVLLYDDVVTEKSVTNPEMIKKTNDAWALSLNLGTAGGARRHAGTFYHFNDTYHTMIERKAAIPRIYPCTDDGTVDGEPVLLTREALAAKRREFGPYIFGCFPEDAPVLMADWTERPISAVRPGDEVVGWEMKPGQKSRLVKSIVKNVQIQNKPLIKATFESGRHVVCTPDHKWYTGRRGADGHKAYSKLGTGYKDLSALVSVVGPTNGAHDPTAAAYLAGIFDGEGHASGNQLGITQCSKTNPAVCERIEEAAAALGFDFAVCIPKKRPHQKQYTLRGGRQEKVRFLRWCNPAKAPKIIQGLFRHASRDFGKAGRDNLVSYEDWAEDAPVWNLETTTGNFVAYGYATKNCQMLLNPIADKAQGFQKEWLAYWPARNVQGLNLYIVVDPASKKKTTSDYTFMGVVGIGEDGFYRIVDMVRDRINLTERADLIFKWHRQYKPLLVGYEEYGLQADIEHIKDRMDRENYRFHVVDLGGKVKKEDRIRRLIPLFEQGRMLLPETCWKRNYEGENQDLTKIFINEEYLPFPVSHHDDMLDGLSRIVDLKTQQPGKQVSKSGPSRTNTSMRRLRGRR